MKYFLFLLVFLSFSAVAQTVQTGDGKVSIQDLGQLPVSTYSGLPTCDIAHDGKLYRVSDRNQDIYRCRGASTLWLSQNGGVYNAIDAGAKGDGSTNDRTALNTLANSTITSSGIIYFPGGTYIIGSNMTFPVGVALRFASGAMLSPADGVTVTIQGAIEAPTGSQIFTNITSGHGAISFNGNRKISQYELPWWGPAADNSADAQPTIQAAINQTPDYSTLHAPTGQKYLINSTISISDRNDLQLVTESRNLNVTGSSSSLLFTSFTWNGATGGTMLSLDRSRYCRIKGFVFFADGAGSADADKAIDIDGVSPGHISTEHFIEDNQIVAPARSTFKGISISDTAISNNEFMHLSHNILQGNGRNGVGFYFGNSSNAHGHTLFANFAGSFNYGIYAVDGGFNAYGRNTFNDNNIDIKIDSSAYPTLISGAGTENSAKFMYVNTGNSPVTVQHCRIASPGTAGQGIVQIGQYAQWVIFEFNDFASISTASYIFDASLATGVKLETRSNRYPNFSFANIFYGFSLSSARFHSQGCEFNVPSCDYRSSNTDTSGNNAVQSPNLVLMDATDVTKKVTFDMTGITTGTVRTQKYPNNSGTIANLNFAQTWTALQTFNEHVAMAANKSIQIKTGSNACGGTASLSSGTATVNTSCVGGSYGSDYMIMLTPKGSSSGVVRVSSVTANTSFVITSTDASSSDTIGWFIVKLN